ncbi:MAG: hypothetical protein GWO20_06860 [Candidatus Korarchaeota archaeon]|nr:hypothetical protein [Candidatus Korarchaeota archaeon]NIU83166.1 hypothetical protein [Candidatus Thorarchaeota archaeon]NIW13548.1 hypothetical protein [Candidatus Thorarchaeota archaeon]NIW51646.1 hypothetical protein [Candidatus Korarchaeota archaeon]
MADKYMIEYTETVKGSMAGRDDGYPYRTTKIIKDKIEAFRFFKEKMDEKGKRYGWERPRISGLQVNPMDEDAVLSYINLFEKTKDYGKGI